MLAVTCGLFLKRDYLKKYFDEFKEEVRFYEDFESLYKDKDKVKIIFNSIRLPEDRIGDFKNLKWIFSYSAGVDTYPLTTLEKMGVVLTNTSGIHKTNIAEQVLGAMIMFSRDFLKAMRDKNEKKWEDNEYYNLSELYGRKILIVGTGKIGKEVGRKADAFDMIVHGVRNSNAGEKLTYFDKIYSTSDLENILGDYDFVVSILPSTPRTKNIWNKTLLNKLNKEAVFINVGRGDAVVEEELIKVLEEGKIKGAYLDVFQVEPLPKDSKLWEMENVIITPHNAGPTPFYRERAMKIFMDNYERFKRGEMMNNIVDYKRKY